MAEQTPAERIREALGDKPKQFQRVQIDERDDGTPIHGMSIPLADVIAGDVVDVAKIALAKDAKDQICKDLMKGCSAVAPDREVACQARCLWHLLSKAGFDSLPMPAKKPLDSTALQT